MVTVTLYRQYCLSLHNNDYLGFRFWLMKTNQPAKICDKEYQNRSEVRKLLLFTFSFSWPEVGNLFLIYLSYLFLELPRSLKLAILQQHLIWSSSYVNINQKWYVTNKQQTGKKLLSTITTTNKINKTCHSTNKHHVVIITCRYEPMGICHK